MLLETTMPVIMMTPISDMILSVLPVMSKIKARRPGRGNGHQDNERVDEGTELRHQDQVDHENGDGKAQAEFFESQVHAFDRATYLEQGIVLDFCVGDELVDLRLKAIECLSAGGT